VTRRPHLAALGVALVLLLSLVGAGNAAGFGPSAIPVAPGKADDCSAATSVVPGSKTSVEYVIWCGPARGRFTLTLAPTKHSAPVRWGGSPRVDGPGAAGHPRCAPAGAERVCRVRKLGPVTIRGRFRVPAGACASKVEVQIKSGQGFLAGEGFWTQPWGCPGSKAPPPPSVARIVRFYLQEDLGPALTGDRAAVVAKAKVLRRAWIEGEPVERWSARAWGAPVDRADAEELALRLRSTEQAANAIPDWIHEHRLGSIYAGWYWGPEGTIYVGFTREAEKMLTRLKADVDFVAPSRVKLFATPPLYTETALEKLTEKVVEAVTGPDEAKYKIVEIGVDILANKVEVGARHAAATRRLLAERFGPDAPIEVVHRGEEELVLL